MQRTIQIPVHEQDYEHTFSKFDNLVRAHDCNHWDPSVTMTWKKASDQLEMEKCHDALTETHINAERHAFGLLPIHRWYFYHPIGNETQSLICEDCLFSIHKFEHCKGASLLPPDSNEVQETFSGKHKKLAFKVCHCNKFRNTPKMPVKNAASSQTVLKYQESTNAEENHDLSWKIE